VAFIIHVGYSVMIDIGIIIEDARLVVQIEEFLNGSSDMRVLFSVASLPSLQKMLATKGEPQVILLEDGLVNMLDYIDLLRSRRNIRTLMYISEEDGKVTSLNGFGLNGCFVRSQSIADLPVAVRYVQQYEAYISPLLAARVLQLIRVNPHERYADILTKRELEIIELVCQGLTYKQIAAKMYITSFTVNQHLKKVYAKMKVHSKSELISMVLTDKNG
jgi:DNA-binding NarL/FixJ family response regulator